MRENERYHSVKHTPEFKEVRANYILRIKSRAAGEPEFALRRRLQLQAIARAHFARINRDPEKREAHLQYKRDIAAAWRKKLVANPEAHEAHKRAARNWYASLTWAERDLIYNEPRRENKSKELRRKRKKT